MTMFRFDTPIPHAPFVIAAMAMTGIALVGLVVMPAMLGSHVPEPRGPVIIEASDASARTTIEVVATPEFDIKPVVEESR
jgi:hypothetical protein